MNHSLYIYAYLFIVINAILSVGIILAVNMKNRYLKGLTYLAIYLLYIIFAAFRTIEIGTGGYDSIVYKNIFLDGLRPLSSYIMLHKEEIGFKVILWAFRHVTDQYIYPLLFFHSLAFFCIVYFFESIKVSKNTIDYVFTFLVTSYLLYMMNILRSGFVVVFSTLFFDFAMKKQYKKACLLLIFLVSIHTCAIILFLPLFACIVIDYMRITYKTVVIVMIPIIIVLETFLMLLARNAISALYFNSYHAEGIAYRSYIVIFATAFMGAICLQTVGNCEFECLYEELPLLYELTENCKTECLYKELSLLLFSLCCIPIQAYFSIAYRMLLTFMPLLYLCIYHIFKLGNTYGLIRMPLQLLFTRGILILYLAYRCYAIFFVEFEHVYPYSNDMLKFLFG